MAAAFITETAAGSVDGDFVVTSGINTTGANFLVLTLSSYEIYSLPTISDSKFNTWNVLTSYSTTPYERQTLYYAINPSVGNGHTFSASSSGSYPAIAVMAFSGMNTSAPFDVQNGNSHGVGGGSTISTGSVTPSQDGSLIVTGQGGATSSQSMTIDNGFTKGTQIDGDVSYNFSVVMAYKIQSTAAAINPTWTQGSTVVADYMSTAIAVFKPIPPSSAIKTINGLAVGSVKTVNGLAIASVKTWNGLA